MHDRVICYQHQETVLQDNITIAGCTLVNINMLNISQINSAKTKNMLLFLLPLVRQLITEVHLRMNKIRIDAGFKYSCNINNT